MALVIKQNNGVVKVVGELSSENASILKRHFNSFLQEFDEIILNLDGVSLIESCGAYQMEQLYLDFIKSNRIISIIGRENKHIAATMKSTKTTYILSDDRI
jgi:anti-anti-sigma regulatory factor